MPHFIIEGSANLKGRVDFNDLMKVVHKATLDSGLFEIGAVRVRVFLSEAYGCPNQRANTYSRCNAQSLDGNANATSGRSPSSITHKPSKRAKSLSHHVRTAAALRELWTCRRSSEVCSVRLIA